MIKEEFVNFKTAKLLKEAGFDVPTRGTWRTNCTGDTVFVEHFYGQTRDDISRHSSDGFQYEYLAPTQSLAARWLREVHGFHLYSKRCYNYNLNKYTWGFWIQRVKYDTIINLEIGFDNSESALEEGIKEALRLIIKKKEYGKRKSS